MCVGGWPREAGWEVPQRGVKLLAAFLSLQSDKLPARRTAVLGSQPSRSGPPTQDPGRALTHLPRPLHVTRADAVTSGGAGSAPARGARPPRAVGSGAAPPTAASGGRRGSGLGGGGGAGCGLGRERPGRFSPLPGGVAAPPRLHFPLSRFPPRTALRERGEAGAPRLGSAPLPALGPAPRAPPRPRPPAAPAGARQLQRRWEPAVGRAVRSGARHVRLAGRRAHGRSGAADPSRTPGTRLRARPAPRSAGGTMKKFSRMPKSEGGGGGGGGAPGAGAGAASGSGGSSVGVRLFAVGRYQVTLEESLAEGTRGGSGGQGGGAGRGGGALAGLPSSLSAASVGPAGGSWRGTRRFALQPALVAAGSSEDKFKSSPALVDARK